MSSTAQSRMARRRAALEKPTTLRDMDDLYLLEELIAGVKFLANLTLEKRLEVCRVLNYELCEPGHKVFQQGEVGTAFYMLLTGKVAVEVVSEDGGDAVEVGQLKEGDSFGELALMQEGSVRAATIKAVEPCELLKVEKDDYSRILKTLMSDELQEKVDFLRQVGLFRDCGSNHLQSIAYVLGARSYKRGEVVVMQGQPSEEMFFICSGSCRVIIAIDVPVFDKQPLRLPGQGGYWDSGGSEAGGPRSRSAHELREHRDNVGPGGGARRPKSAPLGGGPAEVFARQASPGAAGRRPKSALSLEQQRGGGGEDEEGEDVFFGGEGAPTERKFLEIAQLEEGACFGEIGVMLKQPRMASVVASSGLKVHVLNRWDVHKKLGADVLKRLQAQIRNYESSEQLVREYMRTLRWTNYKKRLLDNLLSRGASTKKDSDPPFRQARPFK